jgi:hypothetical protein
MGTVRFASEDLTDTVPRAGWYPVRITSCRWRTSAAGNQMLQVVYGIQGVGAAYARLAEYFVLDEVETGHLAASVSRRRLASLYRAAGLSPNPGDVISPNELVDAELQIEIEPEMWQGRTRCRVVRHRPSDWSTP